MPHSSMFKKLPIILLCSTLFACGGGGSDGDESGGGTGEVTDVLSGLFLDSAVEGLHYQTATQSGLTDNAGRFKYKQDEEVTFSVGGIVLGTVIGAGQVTPFDLFTLTLPTTEADILAILYNDSNVDDYDRVINMVVFLTSLDRDGNLENGLDLTGWHAALSQASLSFEHNKDYFTQSVFSDFSERYVVNKVKTIAAAFAHVIGSLNLNIPVQLIAKKEIDRDNDGTVNKRTLYTYDNQGRQIKEEIDSDVDGNFETINSAVFNSEGLKTQHKVERDTDGSEGQDFTKLDTTNITYNAFGNVLSEIYDRDFNGDGEATKRVRTTSVYDEQGNKTGLEFIEASLIAGQEVPEYIVTYTSTFDDAGRSLTFKSVIDGEADGAHISIKTISYEYNSNSQITKETTAYDYKNADGTIDNLATITYSYDSRGNQLTRRQESDSTINNEGIDSIDSTVETYDENNNSLTRTREYSDYNFGEGIDTPYTSTTRTITYNAEGKKMSTLTSFTNSTVLIEFEYDAQGNQTVFVQTLDDDLSIEGYDSKYISTRSFNEKRQVLSDVFQVYENGDEVIDQLYRTTNTYNGNGRLLTELYEEDSDGIAGFERSYRKTNTYDSNGYQLTKLEERDKTGDGVLETASKTTFSYTPISGGLLGLILQNRDL